MFTYSYIDTYILQVPSYTITYSLNSRHSNTIYVHIRANDHTCMYDGVTVAVVL